ncbi:MAG TPA: hypothetical protein VJV79_36610 [Polyangiaceae bacterium]|nr:hypothetical protein [Polyangiaceae bacterium]
MGIDFRFSAIVAAGFLFSAGAHATTRLGFLPMPGVVAIEIGVGASDRPFVVTPAGRLAWLDKTTNCGGGICVESREWRNTIGPAGSVKHLSVDLYGYAWTIAANNDLYQGTTVGGNLPIVSVRTGISQCTKSFAMSFLAYPHHLDAPFPANVVAPVGPYYSDPSYFISCNAGDTTMLADSLQLYQETPQRFTHTGTFEVYSGVSAVTLFTVDGSKTQIPWMTHYTGASSGNKLYAFYDGSAHGAPFPQRRVAGRTVNYSITSATDHWAAADNCVWRWDGDAYANGRWTEVACSTDSVMKIKQIAYASQIPDTYFGAIGPSNLWVLGTNGQVYFLGEEPGG